MVCDKIELIILHRMESLYPKCHNVIQTCGCPRGSSCMSHLTRVLHPSSGYQRLLLIKLKLISLYALVLQ